MLNNILYFFLRNIIYYLTFSNNELIELYKESLSYLLGVDIKLINMILNDSDSILNKNYLGNDKKLEELLRVLNSNKYSQLQDNLKKIY